MILDSLLRETVVVVLGGGQGTRLFPLTRDRSKPAVPLGGKYRFIDIALSNSINSGLRQIFLLTQYNSASLNNHVSRTYKFDSFTSGFVAVLAAEQRTGRNDGWFQGTADALRQNLKYLRDANFRNVLILPGDHLCRIDLRQVLEMHERRDAEVTLCAAPVPRADVARFRALSLALDGRVTGWVRKPDTSSALEPFRLKSEEFERFGIPGGALPRWDEIPERYLAFMGIYLFKKDVLSRVLETSDDQDLGRDTLPRLVEQYKTFCHVFHDYWRDIGTIRSYYDASMELVAEDPPYQFHDPAAQVFTHARFLPPARVYKSCLDGALLADGAFIEHSGVSHSIIGVRSQLRAGCQVEGSILFGADTFEGENRRAASFRATGLPPLGLGAGCVVKGAIIDKNARIGDRCVLNNDSGVLHADGNDWYIRDGVIVIPKGAVLEPGTVVPGPGWTSDPILSRSIPQD